MRHVVLGRSLAQGLKLGLAIDALGPQVECSTKLVLNTLHLSNRLDQLNFVVFKRQVALGLNLGSLELGVEQVGLVLA